MVEKLKPDSKKRQAIKKAKSAKVDPITVTDGALATIIGLAAHEVPGVVGMAPASLGEGIKRILGVAQADEGVEVSRTQMDDDETTDVDLYVVVAYGVNIPAVADSIRERVNYAAETYAGVQLKTIRIHIAGVSRA
jgi:uncharacterized alkaline shock family protein YloU